MDVEEVRLEEIQHEHPLVLVDLQLMYQNYEEDDDDFEDTDFIKWQNSKCLCDMCGFKIDWYHRYHYKCSKSCHYNLHKFCAELSTTLQFPAHPAHILILNKVLNNWTCHGCQTRHQYGMCYLCSICNYQVDFRCATFVEENMIHHPSHPHPLVYVTLEPILCKCNACGKDHKGVFYHCTTCFRFSIHTDCVALSFKILLQARYFSHPHMLTLSFSFSIIPYGSNCRICGMNISNECWFYKCSKCRYYVHRDCAISRGELFKSISQLGREKNYNDVDYPHLFHCPLPDESCQILPHQLLREKNYRYVEKSINEDGCFKHHSHKHQLVLIQMEDNNDIAPRKSICPSTAMTSSLRTQSISLHNPMKRIKLLCNGCVRPITTMPFYKCNEGCDFYLHEWCTQLPKELPNHLGHVVPRHTLVLSLQNGIYNEFLCNDCQLSCNGFRYRCSECNYCIDVNCGFIPENITHEAHSNHKFSRWKASIVPSTKACHSCHVVIKSGEIAFKCNTCDFYLDSRCALLLPKTIRHKYDKHPLNLSYSPIENHKSQYFCEVCEEDLDPEKWFYHCLECSQSYHSTCAPLKLKSEQGTNYGHVEGVYLFANMKFGGVINVSYHIHPLSFIVGTKIMGNCTSCGHGFQSKLIFKCLQCKYAIHKRCHDKRILPTQLDRFLAFMILGRLKPKENPEEPRHQPLVTFCPSGITRPVTYEWKIHET